MELGEKMKQARLAAGLSQRQLCGDTITRNMLSQIENGTARPSMETLRVLSERLGKSVSYFLEEEAVTSPNQQVMEQGRQAFQEKNYRTALRILEEYRGPDAVFDGERQLLVRMSLISLAEQAIREKRDGFALECMERLGEIRDGYCADLMERNRRMILAKLRVRNAPIPDLDGDLLTLAEAALESGEYARGGHLLDAMNEKNSAQWYFLRGRVYEALETYEPAAACFHRAEKEMPEKVWPYLENCYRELTNYRMAYEYACLQRERKG